VLGRTRELEDDVVTRFANSVATAGDRVAVQCDDARLTYRELDRLTNGLAEMLADRNVAPDDAVVVCLDPGPLAAVALLGVLKAGAAYVPVSPSDPIDRLRYVQSDTPARLVLTDDLHADRVASVPGETIALDRCVQPSSAAVQRRVPGGRLAYILYTSGSSGRPKGVATDHDNLRYYLEWHLRYLRPAAGDIDLPLSSSLCFAAAVTQFYAPLLLGRTQHVLARATVRDPDRVLDWFGQHPDFGIYCVPTLWSTLLRAAERRRASGGFTTGPRCALLSGEVVSPRLVDRSFRVWPQIRLWNLYGPTEAVANASAGELHPGRPPTIGRPIAGTRILLTDEHLRAVEPGQIGEICICGPGVARGYLNLEELTQERFTTEPGGSARIFRTGDMARYDAHGELVFAGRRDFQVKVRGCRVECSEIEQALAQHHAIREAVVVGREDDSDDCGATLTAYLTFLTARHSSVDELRDFLADRLPDYMIPSSFVVLDALPQLPNGKLDRRRLPAPGRARPHLGYPFQAPDTVREARLIRVWERSLGLEGVGANDDFFDLGGDSLKAAAAIAQIRQVLGCYVSYRLLFDHPTPAALAAVLDEQRDGSWAPRPRSEGAKRSACAPNQRNVWLLTQTFGDLNAYAMQFSVIFDGPLDDRVLAGALGDTLERHDALRSTIHPGRGGPEMVIDSRATTPPEIVDLRAVSPAAIDGELGRRKTDERTRPFDLTAGPLLRPILYRLAEERHVLTITVHHLIFDGRSINMFCRDLLDCYEARRGGRPMGGGPERLQFHDWATAQNAGPRAEVVEFWRRYLDCCPTNLDLPTDYPRPAIRGFAGATCTARIDRKLRTSLATLARRHRATPFMLLQAAFQAALYRWSGQDDIVVGCPVSNRRDPGTEDLVGFLANTIVLRTRLSADQSFEDLLGQTRDDCLDVLEHQGVSFDTLLEIVGPDRDLGHSPIFQVMFALHEQPFEGQVKNLLAKACDDGTGGAKYDLVLDIHDDGDTWALRLTYRTDLYAERTGQRWLGEYARLLGAIAADPRCAIAGYDLTSVADRRLLSSWNRTSRANGRNRSLSQLFEEQAARTPERTALIDVRQALGYAELDDRARQLAERLSNLGVAEGVLVGVHVEPSADMVVTLLAILKTGAAYVPLDPYYPSGRLGGAIADSGLRVIVTHTRLAAAIAQHGAAVVAVDSDLFIPGQGARVTELPRGLMYVMYTSGSTGRPKGVMVGTRGPANVILWMRDTFELSPGDRVLSKTSINFDISVPEIFLPLVSGARLVVAHPRQQRAPDALAALIRRERITTIQFVPSALRAFADSGRLRECDSLTRIFAAGEALPPRLAREVLAWTGAELHNLYGPTETSIYSTHWQCRKGDRRRSVPIGRPIDNTAIHILDSCMRPLPIGTPGDLYIGGDGVAEGYLGQPGLTAAAFPRDPFSSESGRLFKTNDRARFLEDGEIEFLGRTDNQVKVRGYRVELDDIAHHLNARSDVRHAIVTTREDQADDVRLVAYLLYASQSIPSDAELRGYLKRELPEYMIPSAFVALDSIPLLPNGKADLRALPAPQFASGDETRRRRVYLGERERQLAEIWEKVLRTTRFGPEDSFFDVGGHSLLIAQLGVLIEQQLDVNVSNIELFQFPTIRTMAAHLDTRESPASNTASEMARRVALRDAKRALAHASIQEAPA
jgi:amino acid adenylation domain-containing protein